MVLVERNAENVRNGRRSRGPSPNGHGGTPDTSSDDDSTKKIENKSAKTKSVYEEKIRVGRDYQVVCPDLVPLPDRKPETLNDRALLVWSPTKDIPESKLEEYISVAKEKYGYNGEQALGMLFWHKHDLERAVLDLANFTPFPDEWTVEDKVLFEQAFQFHGKSFHRIRQMLPDKSIASLVKYYYSWKKTRSRTSVMDHRQEKIKIKEGSENGSENGSNEESDTEEKKWPLHRGIHRASGSPPRGSNDDVISTAPPTNQATSGTANDTSKEASDSNKASATNSSVNSCFGCGVVCNHTNLSPHGALCNSCFHHWRRTGALRPTDGPCYGKRSRGNGFERHKRKPPRGMYINHDDIVSLACPDNEQLNPNRNDLLASMDREISSLLSQIQNHKQIVSTFNKKNSELVEELRPVDTTNRINSRWNNEELLLAVQGVRKFGKDFQGIAEIIGTKTEAQIRTFFVNYRRRYNLDNMLKEYEANYALKQQEEQQSQTLDNNLIKRQEPEIMEIDLEDDNSPPLKDEDDIEEVSEKDTNNASLNKSTRLTDSESVNSTEAHKTILVGK